MRISIKKLIDSLRSFPAPIRYFLLRSLVIFVVWKSLYLFLFAFPRTLDKPLTNLVGSHSVWVLNSFNGGEEFSSNELIAVTNFEGQIQISPVNRIDKNGKKLMHIADSCNGLELFVLYVGFILSMPSIIFRKIIYVISGIVIIHLVNVLRCVLLSNLLIYWKETFDIAHHYIFKIVVYGTIFLLWIKFSQKIIFKNVQEHIL